jgi:hypothetical protein
MALKQESKGQKFDTETSTSNHVIFQNQVSQTPSVEDQPVPIVEFVLQPPATLISPTSKPHSQKKPHDSSHSLSRSLSFSITPNSSVVLPQPGHTSSEKHNAGVSNLLKGDRKRKKVKNKSKSTAQTKQLGIRRKPSNVYRAHKCAEPQNEKKRTSKNNKVPSRCHRSQSLKQEESDTQENVRVMYDHGPSQSLHNNELTSSRRTLAMHIIEESHSPDTFLQAQNQYDGGILSYDHTMPIASKSINIHGLLSKVIHDHPRGTLCANLYTIYP